MADSLGDKFHIFPKVTLKVDNFESCGPILDIGGGGEGVIGQLKGAPVIAVDNRREELEEAADGFVKIVMDARSLGFLDASFSTATAFFSMMYVHDEEDQRCIIDEVRRILRPGGLFHLWDIDLSVKPQTEKEYFLLPISYGIGTKWTDTAYGQAWPLEARGPEYYSELLADRGFSAEAKGRTANTFYLRSRRL